MSKVRYQQAMGRAWLSRDHVRAHCCSPRCRTAPSSLDLSFPLTPGGMDLTFQL